MQKEAAEKMGAILKGVMPKKENSNPGKDSEY